MTSTRAPDRWLDMTKYESLREAVDKTGERALDAVDWTLDFLRFLDTADGLRMVKRHVRGYDDAQWAAPGGLDAILDSDQRYDLMARVTLGNLKRALGFGSTFYVTPRMVALAKEIADEGIDLPLLPTDLPCTEGVIWLAMPADATAYYNHERRDGEAHMQDDQVDPNGRLERFRFSGITWKQCEVAVETRTDAEGGSENVEQEGIALNVVLRPNDLIWRDGTVYTNYALLETTAWAFAREYGVMSLDDYRLYEEAIRQEDWPKAHSIATYQHVVPTIGFQRRFMLALFRLIAQEVAVCSAYNPDRHARRRMARQAPNFGDVLIMRLRRIYDPLVELTDDERRERQRLDRFWSHRWRVREHWRRQPVGKRGEGEWEWRLVRSHVKGPEHLPLIEKDKVYSLER